MLSFRRERSESARAWIHSIALFISACAIGKGLALRIAERTDGVPRIRFRSAGYFIRPLKNPSVDDRMRG